MAVTTYTFYNWVSNQTYPRYGVICGTTAADTRYFYSTTDGNVGANPDSYYSFPLTAGAPGTGVRDTNVMRLRFTQTGSTFFQPGSLVVVAGVPSSPTVNFTGILLAAGSGYVDYLNPGPNGTTVFTAGSVVGPIHPYWTTGFYWVPSWSTEATHNQQVVRTQMGEGYSQRFSPVINSNSLSWNLQFEERKDDETMALLNFLQNQGGSVPFTINFPVGGLYNKPNLKYVSGPASHTLSSYGLNNVSVPITQVFDT